MAGRVRIAVLAAPRLATSSSPGCIGRLGVALRTRERRLIAQDPTERPWRWRQAERKNTDFAAFGHTLQVDVMWLRHVMRPEDAPAPRPEEGHRDAAIDAAYYGDRARCGFDPQPAAGSAAAQILRADGGASLRFAPVAFLESGMDVLQHGQSAALVAPRLATISSSACI